MVNYLMFDLEAMKPLKHYQDPHLLLAHQGQIAFEVPVDADFTFVLVGDLGDGVQLISQINLDTSVLVQNGANTLRIDVQSDDVYFKEEAEVALQRLIQRLNAGESNNPDGAPYQPFTHNAHLFEWVAINL